MNDFFHVTKLSGNDFVSCIEKASLHIPIEQSPLWGKFDDQIAGRQFLGSFRYDDDEGRLVALGSATLYRQRGRDWIWFKHGPLFPTIPNSVATEKFCKTLKKQFQNIANTKPIFIRLAMATQITRLKAPFEHTMYDSTIVLDLTRSSGELYMQMSASSRQAIKKARKAQVTVEKIPTLKTTTFFAKSCYPILAQTAIRAGFKIHPLNVYQVMLKQLQPHIHLFVAYHKQYIIAWSIVTQYQDTAVYYYAAASEVARETEAAYLLQWEVIEYLRKQGVSRYDLMGIASPSFPNLKNVTGFKQKFSKEVTQVNKTYDLPLQLLKYQLLSKLIQLKRRF